ncbi:MAG TPA: sensor domain-containing protein, partial [Solirubrobacterales bacterium]|nr:sensor domain-containing protein [Solirubrobacterales bacterium]
MNFVKRWSRQSGRDLTYAFGMLGTSVIAFCVWVTALSVTVSLLVFVVGVFVWWGSVYLFRWTAWLDRQLAGWIREEEIPAVYRRPREPGVLAALRCVTTDPQTWRDLGWLVLSSVVGFCLATVALTATTIVLAYLTLPIWFSFIPDPEQQYG